MNEFDVIIAGAGALGAAATYSLSQTGLKVLCIDRFNPPHNFSSSTGKTRLFRQAYFEDKNYIALLKRALVLWQELQVRGQTTFFYQNGFLIMSEAQHETNQRVKCHAKEFDIPMEFLTHSQLKKRFPQFRLPPSYEGTFETGAGFLVPEQVLTTLLRLSEENGALVYRHEHIQRIDLSLDSVEIRTDRRTYRAKKIVLALGAFINDFAHLVPMKFTIKRAVQFWFKSREHFSSPCFAFASDHDFIYGFPPMLNFEVKIARYQPSYEIENPLATSEHYTPSELAPIAEAIKQHLPMVDPMVHAHKVCYYTLTDDENFVLDTHPQFPHVVIAAGDSGHAFKFAPVIGEIIKQLVCEERLTFSIDFLKFR
jgi:monomeric sarcosine oxidase